MARADAAVLDLRDVRIADVQRAGPKLARLGELAARGWQVPDGYVVTVEAFERSLPALARRRLEQLVAEGPDFAELSAQARAVIEEAPLPRWLEQAVSTAHERLERLTGLGSALLVAVRSSALAEDAAGASFAGQFETYLGIRGGADVLDHVRKCWAGLYTARALDYRRRHGLTLGSCELAVGVMQLVDARSAGVVFTVDPVGGDRSSLVVEANWGLGESVVSGRVTPDHWVVERGS